MFILEHDIKVMRKRFLELRPTLPPICVMSIVDKNGDAFSNHLEHNTSLIADRLISLARGSLLYVQQHFFSHDSAFHVKVYTL